MPQRFDWQQKAACRGLDTSTFFPIFESDAYEAKRICFTCPARINCLAFALLRVEQYGVWGGLTERERAELRRRGLVPLVLEAAREGRVIPLRRLLQEPGHHRATASGGS